MKNLIPKPYAAARAALLGFLAIFYIGCATSFRGPGPLTTGTDRTALNSADSDSAKPTVSMRENRHHRTPSNTLNFNWPVDDARLTRGYFTQGKRGHWGLDLANRRGTPILAAESGVVIYTGKGFRGYGNLIVIEHNEEWATLYSHLHRIKVKQGQSVKRGETIGTMGRTGRATGVHLHFEIRHNRKPVNPLAHLPEVTNGSLADSR